MSFSPTLLRLLTSVIAYKDMVILPIAESMNRGKTHAFFSWASNHSWVPPLYFDDFTQVPTNLTYLNVTNPAPSLANHDPLPAHRDQMFNSPPKPWVRPDFVVKADDDSFVMLAELEARLRVELHKDPLPPPPPPQSKIAQPQVQPRGDHDEAHVLDYNQIASYFDFSLPSYMTRSPPTLAAVPNVPEEPPSPDPLVFWGYLVKNRFMAGELYALSFALVEWVANDPVVKSMTRGAEDKQTSKWIRAHPRAEQVRWTSERCWIYDHPRAGTVYVVMPLDACGHGHTDIRACSDDDLTVIRTASCSRRKSSACRRAPCVICNGSRSRLPRRTCPPRRMQRRPGSGSPRPRSGGTRLCRSLVCATRPPSGTSTSTIVWRRWSRAVICRWSMKVRRVIAYLADSSADLDCSPNLRLDRWFVFVHCIVQMAR